MSGMRHLIVGGGMTGHAAAAAIREADPDARISMISADPDRPYARPPLSKGLWLGKPEESVWLADVPGLERLGGRRAVSVEAAAREVRDDAGGVHRYDRLLLATGGRPRPLPVRRRSRRSTSARSPTTAACARCEGRRVAVIGGGFIGSEIAAALAVNGEGSRMIFPDAAIGAGTYPSDLARYVTRAFREKGVRVLAGETVVAVEGRGSATAVRTGSGAEIEADVVVAGLGIVPDTGLAHAAGIRCSNGIVVDERLETSVPDVYAAGDVARFPSAAFGEPHPRRARGRRPDHGAVRGQEHGRRGRAVRSPAVLLLGPVRPRLRGGGAARPAPRDRRLLEDALPRGRGLLPATATGCAGVLLWGIFGQVDAARALIPGRSPISRAALADAIPA